MERADEWLDWVTTQMFGLMHNVEADNFDSERYRGQDPNTFFYGGHASYFSVLRRNAANFFAARDLLADVASKDLFDWLVLFRLLGHLHVRLPLDTPRMLGAYSVAEQWRVGDTDESGILGPLSMYAVPVGDDVLCMQCWAGNIGANVALRQYYFDRGGVRIAPATDDHALDVGGCFGDTALFFARDVGETGHVDAFDPMPKHCEIMRENFAMNPLLASRISLHPFGLSDVNRDGTVLRSGIDPGARIDEDLPTRTLDLPRVDFVKMDIEGSELAALKGGERTIRRSRPKLAISLYHRPEDFFAIPLWIASLGCGYRFHLDHYSIHHEETVLYAAAA